MKSEGSTAAYVSSATHPSIPLFDPTASPVQHRPWCTDCKRKHDADDLDDNGRCSSCARAVVTRAEAAARRAAAEAAPTPPPAMQQAARKPAKPKKPRRTAAPKPPIIVRRDGTPRFGPQPIALPDEEIAAAYNAGAKVADLAAKHDVSAPTIHRALRRQGVRPRGGRVDYTPQMLERVRSLYEGGRTLAEISDELGITTKAVDTALAKTGVPKRPAQARQAADRATGLKDRIDQLGVPAREIKRWAFEGGLIPLPAVGLPSRRIVEAYADAHPWCLR